MARLVVALAVGIAIGFGAGWIAKDESKTATHVVTVKEVPKPSPYGG